MMPIITENPDGNYHIVFEWAFPQEIDIEWGELQALQDELNRLFPERIPQ